MYILKSHKSVREQMAVLFGCVGVNVAVQTRRRVAPIFDDVAFHYSIPFITSGGK